MEMTRFDDDSDDDVIQQSESTPLKKKSHAKGKIICRRHPRQQYTL